MTPFDTQLKSRIASTSISMGVILISILVFVVVLVNGGGFWHASSQVVLNWGANFRPATQDGEWWRLGTAMFLHFGVIHLTLNMWALWDGGQWVERMYGHGRFLLVFVLAGLAGNLCSLAFHTGNVISAGASGGVFGVYGALLVYLWLNRANIPLSDFRWLFVGAAVFSVLTIGLGLWMDGIDNAAHIGGLLAGMVAGVALMPAGACHIDTKLRAGLTAGSLFVVTGLYVALPAPEYYWSHERQIRQSIASFIGTERKVTEEWNDLLARGRQGDNAFSELADRLESDVTQFYAGSFDALSALPRDQDLPSAELLEKLQQYARQKRDLSRGMADQWRARDSRPAPEAHRTHRED